MLVRAAKPSHWAPEGQIRVMYDLYLARNLDADNTLKALGDVIERATGINDERYLPCVRTKTSGLPLAKARVEIVPVHDFRFSQLPA